MAETGKNKTTAQKTCKGVKKNAGKSKRSKKYPVSEDKPLTPGEQRFVFELAKTPDEPTAAYMRAYPNTKSVNSARVRASDLINIKPNTRKAIKQQMARYFERLDFGAFDILKRIGHIAFADVTEICEWSEGMLNVIDSDNLTERGKALIASVEENINERGGRTIKLKTKDSMAALRMLCKYYGLLNPSRQAPQQPMEEQVEALRKVRDGESPMDVAMDLEMRGVPLPETLRIMVGKYQAAEEDPEGDSIIPTPEEMEARRQARLREIEEQKKDFLPERQQEVRDIKDSLGEKNNAFSVKDDGGDGK
jgi:hypothetical protein